MEPRGRTFGGRYELGDLIATGGMGQVWKARDTVLSRDVAVKVLRSEYTGDPTFLARFRSEAQLSASLVHPNIATLFDYGEVDPGNGGAEHLAYLVMELVRGESLSALMGREHRLPADRTLDVLRQSAAGLAAAHEAGVVHRDVKPGNVLLGSDGRVKITDFGVARSAATVPLTQTGAVIGTAHYLSPEQAQGARATPASDVYALGMVAYEALSGRRAFEGENPVQIALLQIRETPAPLPDDVPEPVRRLVERALAKEPAERFPDGAAFRNAVDDVIAGRPLDGAVPYAPTAVLPALGSLPPTGTAPITTANGERPQDDGRRRRRLLVPLFALLFLATVVVGALQLSGGTTPAADGAPATTTVAPTTTPAPTTSAAPTVQQIALTLGDYVGRPYPEVQAELQARGLQVTLRPLQTADVPDGQVIALDPVGELTPGTAVTLTHAVAPPVPTTVAPPVVPAPPAAPPAAAPPPAANDDQSGGDQGGNGNGKGTGGDNGKGNGKGNGKKDG
ncbi:serine/threonine protein kinase [Modestobacter sp. DSM 44400]|uniref:protein kinase domain-containing protein n=1 Tax=Modestobacter sp. DSM 44400 TaxID=1550230 RepID=UPI000897D99A|nr:protein kinase [Modestobacter sp. DSM 44400]SDX74658.1 serine/threonine protein kinase [Modestobacter sp. DSM 44400]